MIYVRFVPNSVDFNAFWMFFTIMLVNTKLLLNVTWQSVYFPLKSLKCLPHRLFSWMAQVLSLLTTSLKTITRAKDVFQFVKEFFAKHKLDYQSIGSVSTDGTPPKLWHKSGFSALPKQDIPTVSHIVNIL